MQQSSDFSLNDVPVFIPDVDNWTQPNSDYINVDDLNSFVSCMSFAVLMLNIRSCRKNFNQFVLNFCNVFTHFTCILLTETWLTEEDDNIFNIPGYNCFNLYRNNYGGGLKLYLKNSINARLLKDFTFMNDLLEIITVEVMFGNNRAVFSGLYHPPTSSIENNNAFIECLSNHLSLLVDMKVPVILAGDFNINLLNPGNLVYVNTFLNSMFELGFNPVITAPTKVNVYNPITRFSILDHIWVSQSIINLQSFIFPIDITDHFPVCTFLRFPFNFSFKTQRQSYRSFSQRGKQTFQLLLSNVNIQVFYGNFNLTYGNYVTRIMDYYNNAFPIKMSLQKTNHPAPWLSPQLKQCIKKKSKLYKQYLKGRIEKNEYITYKNRLTAVIRRVKRLYYSRLLFENSNDIKKTWSCINSIIEKNVCHTLKELKVGNVVIKGRELANFVNNHFVTAVSRITANLAPVASYHFLTSAVEVSCFFYPTTPFEVAKVINSLKNHGNRLLDIHPTIVKENVINFSYHFSELYNLSLLEPEFPDKAKTGRVNPVYKSGAMDNIDNYRPISVLPIFSKIYEKLTYIRMMSFINRFDILSSCQFGFRSGRSTTQAITRLVSYILPAYHNKLYSACFFLDLRKAFDTIDHNILMQKLQHYGFRGNCYEYLKSYYTNRKQYVYLNGDESEIMSISNGVPQGSILGPLCFSIFINDLPLAVDAETVLFADDAAFVIKSPSLPDLYSKINKLFGDLKIYLNRNRLVANASKSKLMVFSSRLTQDLPELHFDDRTIEWVPEFKYLGLIITNRLSFSKHINKVSLNVSRLTGMFKNLRTMVPQNVMFKLYYALVYPHLINHIIVWGSAPPSHLKILSIRLNNLLRVLLGVRWINGRPNMHTADMYKTNDLMNIESIFKFHLFKLLKQLLDGSLPDMYSYLLEPHLSPRNYETRNGPFRHPALTNEVERRSLPHQLISLYDNIPTEYLNQRVTIAVRQFKRYLLDSQ